MKRLFAKLFCLHQWKKHAQKEYKSNLYHYKDDEFMPIMVSEKITEVLICNTCGKIKILKY